MDKAGGATACTVLRCLLVGTLAIGSENREEPLSFPRGSETTAYLEELDIQSREQFIVTSYHKAIENLSEVIGEKKKYIAIAYEELTMSAWFFGIVSAIAIGIEILS